MKAYTRRGFTAAGVLAALGLTGCFNPAENRPEVVYGPPGYFEQSSSSTASSSETSSDASGKSNGYDPSLNEIEDVYGPPDDFDPSANQLEDVYGPSESFSGGDVGGSGESGSGQGE